MFKLNLIRAGAPWTPQWQLRVKDKRLFRITLYIQGDSEQTFVFKISNSWMNSKTIFPLAKFCPELSFQTIIKENSLLITEGVHEVGRDGAMHRPIWAITRGARRGQLIAIRDECSNQCLCVCVCVNVHAYTHMHVNSFSLSLFLTHSLIIYSYLVEIHMMINDCYTCNTLLITMRHCPNTHTCTLTHGVRRKRSFFLFFYRIYLRIYSRT